MEELLVETSDRLILCTNYSNIVCKKREMVNTNLSFLYKEEKLFTEMQYPCRLAGTLQRSGINFLQGQTGGIPRGNQSFYASG